MTGRLVLLRHGQTYGNVDRRLDTRPPGAALTELGHEQARTFAREWEHPVGMIAHSVALRATETAADVGAELGMSTLTLDGIHEVQVGELENRNDDAAIEEFNAIYRRWQLGELDVSMPGGESATEVLDRYLPVVKQLRMRYLDDDDWKGDVVVVSHGAAIRLVGAVLGGIEGSFALDHHLPNTQCVVLSPVTDGRWSCVQWAEMLPPFGPEPDGQAEPHPVEDALHAADPMG
jgi:broad specificity phosphatase PhoE